VSPAASDSELLEGNVDRLITRRKFLLAAAGALGVPFVTAPRRAESRVEPVPAKTLSADDLVNRIGVNLHFSFTGWVPEYDQNVGEIISLMQAANIWWARDHAYYEPGHPNDAERSARFKALQAAGIKLCFIKDDRLAGNDPHTAAKIDYVQDLSNNAAGYFEGTNEPDMEPGWTRSKIVAKQKALFNAVNASSHPSIPVLGPSIVWKASAQKIGTAFANYCDRGNMHPYQQDARPSLDTDDLRARLRAVQNMTPGKPLVNTEVGYGTDAVDSICVNENIQSKYTLRALFLSLYDAGFERVFLYEMVDESIRLSGREAHLGLVRADMSPKPVYTSIKRLTQILAEAGVGTFTPQPLGYFLSGAISDVKRYELQKSTGVNYLVLCRDVSSWDIAANTEIINPSATVTLNLTRPASRVVVHDPHASATPISEMVGPISTVNLAVPDTPLVIEVFA
jgi:trimeric autotransporter adhesin